MDWWIPSPEFFLQCISSGIGDLAFLVRSQEMMTLPLKTHFEDHWPRQTRKIRYLPQSAVHFWARVITVEKKRVNIRNGNKEEIIHLIQNLYFVSNCRKAKFLYDRYFQPRWQWMLFLISWFFFFFQKWKVIFLSPVFCLGFSLSSHWY